MTEAPRSLLHFHNSKNAHRRRHKFLPLSSPSLSLSLSLSLCVCVCQIVHYDKLFYAVLLLLLL